MKQRWGATDKKCRMVATKLAKRVELYPFEESGLLVEEGSGLVLLADAGGRYELDYVGSMPAGAWVRVSGLVDHSSASVSRQIAGRIRRNDITPMDSAFDAVGALVERDGLPLLRTDDGHEYAITDAGTHRRGQRVHVRGTLVPLRLTVFTQGEACVLVDDVSDAV